MRRERAENALARPAENPPAVAAESAPAEPAPAESAVNAETPAEAAEEE
jgi:hypothetical protein